MAPVGYQRLVHQLSHAFPEYTIVPSHKVLNTEGVGVVGGTVGVAGKGGAAGVGTTTDQEMMDILQAMYASYGRKDADADTVEGLTKRPVKLMQV